MKRNLCLLLMVAFLFSACILLPEWSEPRLTAYELIPVSIAGVDGYDVDMSNKQFTDNDLFVCLSDESAVNRLGNVKVDILTAAGDEESFVLEDEDIVAFRYAGSTPHYHFFKRINPVEENDFIIRNDLLELSPQGDTLYFECTQKGYPHTVLCDTLYYVK